MIAWLERNVERRPADVLAAPRGIGKRFNFGMGTTADAMETLAERSRPVNERRADRRIRRGAPAPARGKLAGTPQIDAVERRNYGWTSTPFQNAT